MIAPASHDPFFLAVSAHEFRRDHIADLAAGRVAAIRVPDLLPRSVCDQTLQALAEVEFESYGKERVYPPVMRFGVGVSDHRRDGRLAESYWPALDKSHAVWAQLGLPFDPFELCRKAIGADWPGGIAVGTSGGRQMGGGVAREPNQGFQVHFDNALREFQGNLLDANLISQFAFNLYLSVPEVGGETMVWRHRWSPADEAFRLPGSYGFSEAVVGDAESFELKPVVGEALLFDPRNYHAVRPSKDSRRIALGMSIGLSDTGQLLTWG
jgi:2OG-Fe(II) oxygenase superfamily